jgi:hypothetical protein
MSTGTHTSGTPDRYAAYCTTRPTVKSKHATQPPRKPRHDTTSRHQVTAKHRHTQGIRRSRGSVASSGKARRMSTRRSRGDEASTTTSRSITPLGHRSRSHAVPGLRENRIPTWIARPRLRARSRYTRARWSASFADAWTDPTPRHNHAQNRSTRARWSVSLADAWTDPTLLRRSHARSRSTQPQWSTRSQAEQTSRTRTPTASMTSSPTSATR